MPLLHQLTSLLPVAEWAGLLTLVWRAGCRVGQIEDRLELLSTNHLPHLQSELESLRADIRALWKVASK